ncbi:MAG: (Fe-S)-binding protein [Thermodesulfobacteriota bacterium]|nr:(Fe-S)-binding protein [Thermodesulfobacteriota bacterium]
MNDTINQAKACTECGICMDFCPTYQITGEPLFSPMHRIETAIKVSEGEEITPLMLESIYNCPKCMQCETVCPSGIKVVEIIHGAREALVQRGLAPSEKHNKKIEEILEKGNAVNGDPERRLDWLPEEFPRHESDTLLYLGCLPSYLIKDAATSTYVVLKKLGLDFMILKDEGCCGIYIYESGRRDLASEYFQKNVERFKALGIKKIIVPCSGCLKCFKYFYPDILGETEFTVHHAVETIYDLLKEKPDVLKNVERMVTYHDSCRVTRGEGLAEEPREILRLCGAELREIERNKEEGTCCGAGGGIRSVYPKLSLKIATGFLETVNTESIVTACPFCAFNLYFASRRKRLEKNLIYITKIVQDSLQ